MVKVRQRMRCIMGFSLLEPNLIRATTAALSDKNRTDYPVQNCPQRAADITTGTISLTEMWEASVLDGHSNISHFSPS